MAVRVSAVASAAASAELQSEAVLPLFIEALRDAAKEVRIAAVQALGTAGKKSKHAPFVALVGAFKDAEPDVRQAVSLALRGLEPLGNPEVPSLLAALSEDQVDLRRYAVSALGQLAPRRPCRV